MVRRHKRCFGDSEKEALLKAIGDCRSATIEAGSEALFNKPVYDACGKLTSSIDDLAEVLTGDRTHFYAKDFHIISSGSK